MSRAMDEERDFEYAEARNEERVRRIKAARRLGQVWNWSARVDQPEDDEEQTMSVPMCTGCGKRPDEIEEYVEAGLEEDMTPDEYVREEEGTYNPENGHFLCTDCYVRAGMPSSPSGWVAP